MLPNADVMGILVLNIKAAQFPRFAPSPNNKRKTTGSHLDTLESNKYGFEFTAFLSNFAKKMF